MDKMISCSLCDFQAYSKGNLSFHLTNVHFKDKEYMCRLCHFKTAYKGALTRHVNSVHLRTGKEKECPICGYVTASLLNLNSHLSTSHHLEIATAFARPLHATGRAAYCPKPTGPDEPGSSGAPDRSPRRSSSSSSQPAPPSPQLGECRICEFKSANTQELLSHYELDHRLHYPGPLPLDQIGHLGSGAAPPGALSPPGPTNLSLLQSSVVLRREFREELEAQRRRALEGQLGLRLVRNSEGSGEEMGSPSSIGLAEATVTSQSSVKFASNIAQFRDLHSASGSPPPSQSAPNELALPGSVSPPPGGAVPVLPALDGEQSPLLKCSLCPFGFNSSQALTAHISLFHLNGQQHLLQQQLLREQSRQQQLLLEQQQQQQLLLRRERVMTCSLCDFSASQRSVMEEHIGEHRHQQQLRGIRGPDPVITID